VQQLGELQKSAEQLRAASDVFVINNDSPEDSRRLKRSIGLSLPVLLDRDLQVARSYDMLPKPNQPMGMMSGVAQMRFVIIDRGGIIRLQHVDTHFGDHAAQILDILHLI
jgi:peroxiredoxin